MNILKNYILKTILILISSAIIGALLLWLVFLLPTAPMKENVRRGYGIVMRETLDGRLAEGYPTTYTDNYTNALMFSHSVAPVENAFIDSVKVNSVRLQHESEGGAEQALSDYVNGVEEEYEFQEYPRYWHGYLVILKPLLLFLDFSDIRVINMIVQLILMIACVISFERNNLGSYNLALLGLFIIINPYTTAISAQLSTCMYVLLISILVCINGMYGQRKWLTEPINQYLFFLVIGIVTVYVDFLTWPIVTLAVPLTIVTLSGEDNILQRLRVIIINSIGWSVGYLMMWIEKWIYASIVLGRSIIKDALAEFGYWENGGGVSISRMDGILKQFGAYAKWPYLLLVFGILVWIYLRYRTSISKLPHNIKPFLIALLPFVAISTYSIIWYFFINGHCYEHVGLNCRILGLSYFALVVGIIKGFDSINREQNNG